MSDYSSLKATINANVKTNDNHEITGAIMNSVLNAMVNALGAGYQFMGVATPTNPGTAQTPDYKCFYLATTPGTYTYLRGLVVADGEVALLKYDSSWTKEVTGIASADKLNQLGQEYYVYFANWQFVNKYISNDYNIGDVITGDTFNSQPNYNTFKVFVPKGLTCLLSQLYNASGSSYIYVCDLDNKITNKISKGESSGVWYDIEYTATEDCYIVSSSYVSSSSYNPYVYYKDVFRNERIGEIIASINSISAVVESGFGRINSLLSTKKYYKLTDGLQQHYYDTTSVSVDSYINPFRYGDYAPSAFYSFCLRIDRISLVEIKDLVTASATPNIVLTDLNFKVTEVISTTTGTGLNKTFVKNEPGYILLTTNSTLDTEIAVTSLSSDASENIITLYEKFEGSEQQIRKKYISNDYASTLSIGDTLDESRFESASVDTFNVAKIRVRKGETIAFLQWYFNSADTYIIITDLGGKIKYIENWSGSIQTAINFTKTSNFDGYLYVSQNIGTSDNRDYSSLFGHIKTVDCVSSCSKQIDEINKDVREIKTQTLPIIKTLDESIFARMKSGDAVKIGFLGDSTTDGVGTTGFNRPVNGHEGSQWDNIYDGGPGTIGSTDYINQETYPYKLEQLLKAETGNNSLRVYNMGWAGKTYKWAYDNREDIFGGAYSDVELVGLAFGINDTAQYGSVLKTVLDKYEEYLLGLIEYIYSLGKGVFIVNPQCAIKGNWDGYPTSNQETALMFRNINKQIATKYNLALIEMTNYDLNTVINSSLPCKDIMDDTLHFTSLGHTFEAGFLFSEIVSRVVKGSKQSVISYNQYNWLDSAGVSVVLSATQADIYEGFKTCISSAASGNDILLMDVYILNDSDSNKEVFGYVKNLDTQHCIVTDTLLNQTDVAFASVKQKLADLGVGEFKHFVIKSGTGRREFYGIKME